MSVVCRERRERLREREKCQYLSIAGADFIPFFYAAMTNTVKSRF